MGGGGRGIRISIDDGASFLEYAALDGLRDYNSPLAPGALPKTVLLFFIPQLLNFVYSLPQLARIVPCPRHRMPAYLQREDKLCNSFFEVDASTLGSLGRAVVWSCETFRLAKVERRPGSRCIHVSNFTLINFVLYLCGPMHERDLASVLLLVQVVCSAIALAIRYHLAGLFYDIVK